MGYSVLIEREYFLSWVSPLFAGDRSDVRLFIDILGGSGYWRNYITHQVGPNVVHQGTCKDGKSKDNAEEAIVTSAK